MTLDSVQDTANARPTRGRRRRATAARTCRCRLPVPRAPGPPPRSPIQGPPRAAVLAGA